MSERWRKRWCKDEDSHEVVLDVKVKNKDKVGNCEIDLTYFELSDNLNLI